MRHEAWLQAIPDTKDSSGIAEDKKSRREQYKEIDENHNLLQLPEIGSCEYLVKILFDIGPCLNLGMGLCALSWTDISSWQECTGVELDAWQANLIRRLSIEYAQEYSAASDPNRPAPYIEETFDREEVGDRLYAVLKSFKQKQ